jgi:hypothetical protein
MASFVCHATLKGITLKVAGGVPGVAGTEKLVAGLLG